MRAQYGVTAEEVFSYVDGAMFWEASFGFRPADCYVTAAGNKKKDEQERVLPGGWTQHEYDEVCQIFARPIFYLFFLLFPAFFSCCLSRFMFSVKRHTHP